MEPNVSELRLMVIIGEPKDGVLIPIALSTLNPTQKQGVALYKIPCAYAWVGGVILVKKKLILIKKR